MASLAQNLLVPAALAAVIAVVTALATLTNPGRDAIVRYSSDRLSPDREQSFRRWLIVGGVLATSVSSVVAVLCVLASFTDRR
jgi:hypothetical protein